MQDNVPNDAGHAARTLFSVAASSSHCLLDKKWVPYASLHDMLARIGVDVWDVVADVVVVGVVVVVGLEVAVVVVVAVVLVVGVVVVVSVVVPDVVSEDVGVVVVVSVVVPDVVCDVVDVLVPVVVVVGVVVVSSNRTASHVAEPISKIKLPLLTKVSMLSLLASDFRYDTTTTLLP